MDDAVRQSLEARLGYTFRDPSLLDLALRHASIAEARVQSNERLEFLGDAVLGLVVCQRIYEKFPELLEGEMTKIKSHVVSRQTCAQMGRDLGLAEFLEIGKGMKTFATLPISLAAAALEAVIAGIYLDGGLDPARAFLLPRVEPWIDKAASSGHQENFKSILQQHAQQVMGQTPAYQVLTQRGPDHAKHFHICVQIGERRFEASWGASKKQAEQQAALNALHELGITVAGEDGAVHLVRRSGNGTRSSRSEKAAKDGVADETSAPVAPSDSEKAET